MAWRRPRDKPLSEPMMVSLLTHICVTRPQWVKGDANQLEAMSHTPLVADSQSEKHDIYDVLPITYGHVYMTWDNINTVC